MTSAPVTLLFLAIVTAENITEILHPYSTLLYPIMLPQDFVVIDSLPPVEPAGPNMKCDYKKFCYAVIPAAMGAYAKGVVITPLASAVFTGEGNSEGFAIAIINSGVSHGSPSYPNTVYGESLISRPNGTKLFQIYRFNRRARKIDLYDNMTAVKNLSSRPVFGLYSSLFLPPEQQDYVIVVINVPGDGKNCTLTFKLPDNTNRTYYFRRQRTSDSFSDGWEDIEFRAPDTTTSTTTTTSGADHKFSLGIYLMAFAVLPHWF